MLRYAEIMKIYETAIDAWFDGANRLVNTRLRSFLKEYNEYVRYKRSRGFHGWEFMRLDRAFRKEFDHRVYLRGRAYGVF